MANELKMQPQNAEVLEMQRQMQGEQKHNPGFFNGENRDVAVQAQPQGVVNEQDRRRQEYTKRGNIRQKHPEWFASKGNAHQPKHQFRAGETKRCNSPLSMGKK